jgi:hypothetical protein
MADSRPLRPRGHHLHEQEEAPVGADIDGRAVDERVVEHHHLAGLKNEVHRLRFVEGIRDVLAPGENALGIVALLVLEMTPLVRARNAPQASLVRPARGQREGPEHHRHRRAVHGVLVPSRDGLGVGLLHPPRHAPAADVGSDQILEDVQGMGILGDVEHPRAEEVLPQSIAGGPSPTSSVAKM